MNSCTALGCAAVVLVNSLAIAAPAAPKTAASARNNSPDSVDWPQYCGPNRDSVAENSPKLLDVWPKEGPPLLWKSDWLPGWTQGGCGGPAVADGKVFVYATAKNPVDGSHLYKLVTPEVLEAAGWMPGIPPELAKRVEDARTKEGRPDCKGWMWVEMKDPAQRDKDLEAFLAKRPELDKYIKDVIATLTPEEAKKYGRSISNRLCVATSPIRAKGSIMVWDQGVLDWNDLSNLSKLQGVGYPTLREWSVAWTKASRMAGIQDHLHIGGYFPGFLYSAWIRSFTRTDLLVCLDARTGKTLWRAEFPISPEIAKSMDNQTYSSAGTHLYMGICETPAVADGRCYFAGLTGLYCLSTKDGSLLWQAKAPASHTSVLVADNVAYYCGAAYDAKTGQLLWKYASWKDGGDWHGSHPPALWRSGGKTFILAHNGNEAYACLELETGKEMWRLRMANQMGPCNVLRADGDVMMDEGKLYRMTPDAIQPAGTLAELSADSGFFPGTMYQDHIYAATDPGHGSAKVVGLCCWDARTGDLKWGGANVFMLCCAPPLVADGKMIMADGVPGQEGYIFNNWRVVMARATPERYMQLGAFAPDLIPWTPLALADGKLLVRTELGISCYDLTQQGPYLDKTVVTKDKVTFVFQQTGGGITAGDIAKDVLIAVANSAPQAPAAKIEGDAVVVDVKDAPLPFAISCGASNSLTGKSGRPLPGFAWDGVRDLKFRTCFSNMIVLTCDRIVPQDGRWNAGASYTVVGARITNAKIDPLVNTVTLTADKVWKPGESVTLTVPRFHVDQGEPLREKLTFTARDSSAATLVKIDETTSGSWKGVYGADGAFLVGDTTSTVKCAIITRESLASGGGVGESIWAASTNDTRALQKIGDAKDRMAGCWVAEWTDYKVDVEITDGKEHQMAVYCLDWDKFKRSMTVEVRDPWRKVALAEKLPVKEFENGKYLVFNVKGHVELKLFHSSFRGSEVSGIFFDPVAAATK